MTYMLIGQQEMLNLRRQRLQTLEAEHYLASLAVEEEPRDIKAAQDVVELERRITHHREVIIAMAEALKDTPETVPPIDEAEKAPADA